MTETSYACVEFTAVTTEQLHAPQVYLSCRNVYTSGKENILPEQEKFGLIYSECLRR